MLPNDIEAIFSEQLAKTVTVGERDLVVSMKVFCEQVQYSPFLRERAFELFVSSSLKDFAKKLLSRALTYRNQKPSRVATVSELKKHKLEGDRDELRAAYTKYVGEVVKSYNAEIATARTDQKVFDLVLLSVIKQFSSLYIGN